jgi:hypothetical protein
LSIIIFWGCSVIPCPYPTYFLLLDKMFRFFGRTYFWFPPI